jgi:nucleoside-diphosphate-sugar epimerase
MAKRVLVTGASGFVGRHLLPALVANGFDVIACGRHPPEASGAAFRAIDDIATADWSGVLAGVDAVVHAAGVAHTRSGADADYDSTNAEATLRLAAQSVGRVGRLVFLSSIRAISGPVSKTPLDELSPAAPTDAYGRSKLKAERGLATLDLPTISLRPVVIYGDRVKGNLARIQRLADTGLPLPFASLRAQRSFLCIDNLVSATMFALAGPANGAQTFVVADPPPSNVADLVAGLREGLGRGANLIACPPVLLGAAARLAGHGESWATVAGPMIASSQRLLDAGWRPPVASTIEGARRWGRAVRAAKTTRD